MLRACIFSVLVPPQLERSLLLDLDTKTFQEATAQLCPVFDWFLIWAMGVRYVDVELG
jgi:hypothetical protein